MTTEAVLGLDAGTSSAKAVVVAADGRILSTAASDPIPLLSPDAGAAEQDPRQLVGALEQAARTAVGRVADEVEIVALAVAAQSGSVVPIGEGDRPVGGLVTWMDSRSAGTVAGWDESEKALVRAVSGWTAAPGTGLATVSWLQSSNPDLTAVTRRWASADDLVGQRLTGLWSTNPSNASGMQFMDVTSLQWDARLCRLAGIEAHQLSPIAPSGHDLATLTPEAAAALGIGPGATVVTGGHDQACTALALGAVSPGTVVVSVGTAWVLTAVVGRVDVGQLPPDLNLSPHVTDQTWSASQNLGGLGAVLSWWRGEAHGPDAEPSLIDADLEAADGLGPIFVPELGSSDQGGLGGRFEGVRSHHTRADHTHAVVEAAAFEIRRALESMSGSLIEARDLVLVGGSARSDPLLRMVADVTGSTVTSPGDASWPALGAATLAAQARGWPTPEHVSAAALVAEPRADTRSLHEDRYGVYLRLMEQDPR